MNKFFNSVNTAVRTFAKEEEGAQIIEYALIVAVISLGLIGLMQSGLLASTGSFSQWMTKVGNLLTGTTTP